MTDTVIEQLRAVYPDYAPYRVSVDEYIRFREQGFLAVRGLIPQHDVQMLVDHTDNILAGRESFPNVPAPSPDLTPMERLQYYLRVHMLHRVLPLHERFMLHPRTIDVLEALIGPDVLALQTMLFFKGPGQPGQGYHQDAYYIPTLPDTLCGAWLAVDRADEDNGCLWFTVGSQHEPIYPDWDGQTKNGDTVLGDIEPIANASNVDVTKNELTRVAARYAGREIKVEADPGDVVFFAGHVLHRSHGNHTAARSRRAFVGHYCNARSAVPWNHGDPYEGEFANHLHILARGTTHLPYAQPRFGTPCAANIPAMRARPVTDKPMSMMSDGSGIMLLTAHADEADHH
ncbi:MAG: phytanoyl-CoA dioxygenase family protein [Chloroflexi bacterium]|nr:phytanoyl-CoA dioxygenase family protein [Chloroflexota bacterium]